MHTKLDPLTCILVFSPWTPYLVYETGLFTLQVTVFAFQMKSINARMKYEPRWADRVLNSSTNDMVTVFILNLHNMFCL